MMTNEMRRELLLQALRLGGNILVDAVGNNSSFCSDEVHEKLSAATAAVQEAETAVRREGLKVKK